MEVCGSDRMLQVAERNFLPPKKKVNGHIEGQLCCDAQDSGENVGTGVHRPIIMPKSADQRR